jgi:DNA-binding beta-propeller fold protein YncE
MFRFGKINIFHPQLSTGVSPGRAYLLAMSAAVVAALLALVVLIGFGSTRAQADPRPDLYLLPPEALYPEGIAAENESGTFYVSSVADGSIYRGNVGNEQAELFLPGREDGRTQAAGLALEDGLLYVAGGQTGTVFVYDTSSGDLVRRSAALGAGFLNDVTVNPHSGDAYITDSFVPILWRVPAEEVTGSPQTGELEPWLDLTGTPIAYTAGFNLNGIVATPNGRYLLTVQSNTGNLYRIDTQTKQVTQVDLGGATLTGGDGLVLRGHTLYVVRNQEIITEVSLAGQFTSGRAKGSTSEPSLDFSTTGALVRGRLLVVNSQFDEGGPVGGTDPEIPFTVSSMRAP